jgi:hypothetical protein
MNHASEALQDLEPVAGDADAVRGGVKDDAPKAEKKDKKTKKDAPAPIETA